MERLVRLFRVRSSRAAAGMLVASNLLPLLGVVLWGWDLYSLLVLYWLENGIVGILAIGRILRAEGPLQVGGLTLPIGTGRSLPRLAIVPFFVVHYGLFWLGHGFFVLALPVFFQLPGAVGPPAEFLVIGPDGRPAGVAAPGGAGPDVALQWDAILVGGIGLALSHGSSFVLNYLRGGEYLTASAPAQAMAPYGRVVVLHVTIIVGGIVSILLGSPVGAVVVLVALKTAIDLALHLREHGGEPEPQILFSAT